MLRNIEQILCKPGLEYDTIRAIRTFIWVELTIRRKYTSINWTSLARDRHIFEVYNGPASIVTSRPLTQPHSNFVVPHMFPRYSA